MEYHKLFCLVLSASFLLMPGAFFGSFRPFGQENFMNKRVSYTVDLSGVGCGCNAALYMVSMKESEAVRGLRAELPL